MSSIEKGAIVRLKSGSPAMTVNETREDGQVVCVWCVDGKMETCAFDVDALMIDANPKEKK
jgi:uncharacterized protein YodC (DUF2158 family)